MVDRVLSIRILIKENNVGGGPLRNPQERIEYFVGVNVSMACGCSEIWINLKPGNQQDAMLQMHKIAPCTPEKSLLFGLLCNTIAYSWLDFQKCVPSMASSPTCPLD